MASALPSSSHSRLFELAIMQTRDYALFLLDPKGHVITWNTGAERLKGYAPEDIIGRHFSTFYTADSVASGWPDHELRVASMEGRFEDEGWRVRKDGSRFWANVVITALRDDDGQLLGFSKITRDITSRKLQEEALAQSEERFRLLVEGVVDYAIYMLDPDGFIVSWNSGAARIKGYPASEIIGKHFSRFFTPEDIEEGKPWAELAQARRVGRSEVEGWRVKKNGEHFWARAVVSALHDAQGRLRGYAKVTQDLSQRKQVQALEQAARNVNEFIAILAHELRNPLAPIRTALSVLDGTEVPPSSKEAMLGIISRQTEQLTRIVDDMLDITRVTRGELHLERTTVNLNEVARLALETAQPAIDAADHHVELALNADLPSVYGDHRRLTQIVTNLLSNAARYTAPGGTVVVSTAQVHGVASLTVRDSGRGIAPEWRERIFDMFVQGRPVLERVGGGLGIGLALSRRIAELHGGTLTAYSEGEGQGSEFTLTVPLTGERAAAMPQLPAVPAGSADGPVQKRVLVVDDNSDAANTLALLLMSMGHVSRVANTGGEALEHVREFRPDIVLLDIGLPDVDGYEVARQLRSVDSERTVRIVAVTGWGQEDDRQRARESGFDLHLVKPVDTSALKQALGE